MVGTAGSAGARAPGRGCPLYAKGVMRDGAASGTACRRFEYRVMLPGQADPDKITASLADGVLAVAVPEAEAGKPRRSEITG